MLPSLRKKRLFSHPQIESNITKPYISTALKKIKKFLMCFYVICKVFFENLLLVDGRDTRYCLLKNIKEDLDRIK